MGETAHRESRRETGLAALAGTGLVIGFYLAAIVALLMASAG